MRVENKASKFFRLVSAGTFMLSSACTKAKPTITPEQKTNEPPPTETTIPTSIPTLSPFPSPTQIDSLTPIVTPPPILLPSSPIPPPTEQPTTEISYFESDAANKYLIETSRKGDSVFLKDPLIEYVIKLPRPGFSDAVYGVLAGETPEGIQGYAIIDNFDCEFERLAENNELGNPLGQEISPVASGAWKPDVRLEELKAKIFIESSAGTIPVITSQEHIFQGETKVCPKQSIFEGIGDLPEKTARVAGRTIKKLIEGFKEGYFEE